MGDGVFISFEGGEGTGKSTQVRMLAETYRAAGREVVVTREPGGTPIAEQIRAIILANGDEALCDRGEALLFAAARAQHVEALIRPALNRGAIVITDRFLDSSVAYQGHARDMQMDTVRDLSLWATGGLLPDVTVLLSLPPHVGLSRVHSRGDANRLDKESEAFHARVQEGFDILAEREPERFVIVDAEGTPDEVHRRVLARIGERFTVSV